MGETQACSSESNVFALIRTCLNWGGCVGGTQWGEGKQGGKVLSCFLLPWHHSGSFCEITSKNLHALEGRHLKKI